MALMNTLYINLRKQAWNLEAQEKAPAEGKEETQRSS